ncbi:MAG: hypothetical protein ACKVX7_04665 [Planctomycetota bacterium]
MSSPSLLDGAPRLKQLLRGAKRRQLWLVALEGLCWGVAVGALGAAVVTTYHRIEWPTWSLLEALAWPLVVGPIVGIPVVLFLSRRTRTRAALEAALAIEERYQLHQRLSSLIYCDYEAARGHAAPAEVTEALLQDGERHLGEVQLAKVLPVRRPRATWPALVATVVFVASLFLPQLDVVGNEKARRTDAAEKQRIAEAKKKLGTRLEKLRELAKRESLSPETQKLLAKMQELEPQPPKTENAEKPSQQNGQERRAALANMQNLKDQTEALRTRPEMKALDKFLEQVRSSGERLESAAAREIEKALSEGSLAKAAESMRELAKELTEAIKKDGKDSAKAQAMAKDLEKLLKKLGDMPGVSSQLAEALKSLDLAELKGSELSESMNGAAAELETLARLLKERDVLDKAQEQIEFTEEELANLPKEWPEEGESEQCEECKKGGT